MISSGPRAFTNLATISLASLYFFVARALRACTPPAGSNESKCYPFLVLQALRECMSHAGSVVLGTCEALSMLHDMREHDVQAARGNDFY